jgi:hypothetical protein
MKEEIISTGHVGAGVMTLTNRTRTLTQLFIDCAREVAKPLRKKIALGISAAGRSGEYRCPFQRLLLGAERTRRAHCEFSRS